MPIVTVTALPAEQPTVDRVLSRIVVEVAAAAGCSVGDVWASYIPAAAQHVGERRATASEQCPIVVMRGRVRDVDTVLAALSAAATAVEAELGVPAEDVWLQWIDVVSGRAYAGGGPL